MNRQIKPLKILRSPVDNDCVLDFLLGRNVAREYLLMAEVYFTYNKLTHATCKMTFGDRWLGASLLVLAGTVMCPMSGAWGGP